MPWSGRLPSPWWEPSPSPALPMRNRPPPGAGGRRPDRGGRTVLPPPRYYYRSYSPRQVAELLYRRHGAQEVLLVREAGDVFEAEIVDRRGQRVRFIVARDTAEVLDRQTLGGERWTRAGPTPPGTVPREPEARTPREARGAPAERSAPDAPRTQDAPGVPAPSVGPVERRPLPEPPVAAKPSGPDAEPAPPRAARPDASPAPAARAPGSAPAKPELAKPDALQPEAPRATTQPAGHDGSPRGVACRPLIDRDPRRATASTHSRAAHRSEDGSAERRRIGSRRTLDDTRRAGPPVTIMPPAVLD